jgi:DNA-binding PadR family transcriptional regulator
MAGIPNKTRKSRRLPPERVRKVVGLTLPDLVVLSLLSEEPMHGYQLVLELERREVKDWAAISRPQVYYSLKKLEAAKLIEGLRDDDAPAGPERRIYTPTSAAKSALADSLGKATWASQRPPTPFITWTVLSIHARRKGVASILRRRRAFLHAQIKKERRTLEDIRLDSGPTVPVATSVVKFALRQFELELAWLDELEEVLQKIPS